MLVGLPQAHKWIAAMEHAQTDRLCKYSRESCPASLRSKNGTVNASLPLSYGVLIENFGLSVRKAGCEFQPNQNPTTKKLVLAGVLLVSVKSPWFHNHPHRTEKMLFINTLIDKGSCHMCGSGINLV
jgi:hypothetical protein